MDVRRQLYLKAVFYYNSLPKNTRSNIQGQTSIFQFVYVMPFSSGDSGEYYSGGVYGMSNYYNSGILTDPQVDKWKVTFQYIGAPGEDIRVTPSDIMILSSERLTDLGDVECMSFNMQDKFVNPDDIWQHVMEKGTYSPTRVTFISHGDDGYWNREIEHDNVWLAVPRAADFNVDLTSSSELLFKIRPQYQMQQYTFNFTINEAAIDEYTDQRGLAFVDTFLPFLIDGQTDINIDINSATVRYPSSWEEQQIMIPVTFMGLNRNEMDRPFPRFVIKGQSSQVYADDYTESEYIHFQQLQKNYGSMESRDGRYAFIIDSEFLQQWDDLTMKEELNIDLQITIFVKQQFVGSDRYTNPERA